MFKEAANDTHLGKWLMGIHSSCVSWAPLLASLNFISFIDKTKDTIVLPRGYGEGQ